MKKYNGWNGTNDEILWLVKAILNRNITGNYPELNERELKSLFCAALASNIVTSEIREGMAFQFENGEDGSERRKELDALRDKYLAHAE